MAPQLDVEADSAATGLIGEDCLSLPLQQDDEPMEVPFSIDAASGSEGSPRPASSKRWQGPYLPTLDVHKKCKGSVHLAFLSHACFLTASLFYVRLSFVSLAWIQFANSNNVPREILDADDDEVWSNENGSILTEMREYDEHFRTLTVLGAGFFVLVGMVDWMRYCDVLNTFMIFAGAAGVASGMSESTRAAAAWEALSVHLYFLEALNLVKREHEHERNWYFRTGEACFLVGSILDIIGSYLGLAKFEGLAAYYMDITSCFLWLACSLIDLMAEVYFVKMRLC